MICGIPIGALQRAVSACIRSNEQILVDFGGRDWEDVTPQVELEARGRRRPRNAERTDRWYADAAWLYLELAAAGHPAPRKEAAVRMGVPARNAGDLFRRCRQLGLLVGPDRNGNGGALTTVAQELLNQGEN
jgi:hypothetical protein